MMKPKEAFYVSKKENIFYLSGFWSNDARLVLTNKKIFLLLNPLEIGNVVRSDLEVLESNLKNLDKILQGQKKIFYEAEDLKVSSQKILRKFAPLQSKSLFFEKQRFTKKAGEIVKMKKSSQIADLALEKVLPILKTGISEQEFAWKLEQAGRDLGAESVSFDFIVAFGKHSAIPHHQNTTKKLQKNMPILLDWGFKKNHYCSDISRSFFYGSPSSEWCQAYELVLKATKEAQKIIKTKTNCAQVHIKAVEIFTKQAKFFVHSLGHGIGLEIHEPLHINAKSKNTFQENMTFSVEPGLYFPEQFGIRLEDTCLLQKNCQSLNNFPQNLQSAIISF